MLCVYRTQTLTTLDLGFNAISNIGRHLLADVLLQNKKLIILNLEHNKIDDECAQHFADSLRKNKTLQELMLSNNQISSVAQRTLKTTGPSNQIFS
ncbi:unnamed protein product [Rotaria socialis]|uniref:Uncharacterized protein n=1 Tax=Rotaria socialis TaxID=392032 RepID=A0A820YYC2_9BILA|nr:unnamed protein product [Rotaria socialis]